MAVQATLAAALLAGLLLLWQFLVLSALLAVGEGFFNPALGGLRAEIVPPARLPDANAMLGVVQSAATVAGPALAGLVIALSSPAMVIAADAASFGASVVALALLRVPAAGQAAQSPWRDLTESWAGLRSQAWLWVTTVQFGPCSTCSPGLRTCSSAPC